MIGETVGSYKITGLISEGGMGVVYRAEHVLIGRSAAVKVLLPQFSTDRDIIARFFNEAKVTSSIRHPGIIEIFDFGFHPQSGQAFLVMEFLNGESLAAHLAKVNVMDEGSAAWLTRTIANALAAAHECGVVHRDLKPDNIFLVPDADVPGGRRPKILDFGIAKLAQLESGSVKTRTGAVLGTPAYMSPEQCRGTGEVDHRADLYSVGCILYELVCGRPPFESEGAGEIIGMHLHVPPEPPRRRAPHLSPTMEALILLLLAKRPEGRPASAADLIARLDGHYGRPATLTSPGSVPERPASSQPHHSATVMAPSMPLALATPKPTTLGGSASEVHRVVGGGGRKRWPLAAAAVGVALVAGVALAVVMGGKGKGKATETETETEQTENQTRPTTTTTTTTPTTTTEAVAEPAAVVAPEPAAEPEPAAVAAPEPVAVPVAAPEPAAAAVVVKEEPVKDLTKKLPGHKPAKRKPEKKKIDKPLVPRKPAHEDPIETEL